MKMIEMLQLNNNPSYLIPNWPAPSHVRAVATTRLGGYSAAPYTSFNFGEHVGDNPSHLQQNCLKLQQDCQLSAQPVWIKQVHGADVICADNPLSCPTADASYTSKSGVACVITTADCLPILLTSTATPVVAAVHAGWRGLAGGVIENTIAQMPADPSTLMAWIGPGICQPCYEIAEETRAEFLRKDPNSAGAFIPSKPGHWYADLYALACLYLRACGVQHIFGGDVCTYTDTTRFYSARRDRITGRFATLIWMV